jgi:hypothetical protein
MSNHRFGGGTAHGLEPTVDWRALFVLSGYLSAAICIALALLL